MLLWTLMYRFLCGPLFSFLLGIRLGVELLIYMETLYLTFWGTARQFCKLCTTLHFYWQYMRVSIFSTFFPFVITYLFDYSHPSGVKWYLSVDLICNSLMVGELNIFSFVYLTWTDLLWRNAYSDLLILKLGCLLVQTLCKTIRRFLKRKNAKNRTTIWSSNFTGNIYSAKMKTLIQKDTCIQCS